MEKGRPISSIPDVVENSVAASSNKDVGDVVEDKDVEGKDVEDKDVEDKDVGG